MCPKQFLSCCYTSIGFECQHLASPEHGVVVVSGTVAGSVATYRCDSGFVLVGSKTRTCQDNGVWSGTEPFCRGGYCSDCASYSKGILKLKRTE